MKKETVKRIIKIAMGILGGCAVVVVAYVLYVVCSYSRIEDWQKLPVKAPVQMAEKENVQTGQEYTVLTYNIGFGAYTPDFSFFMDGGEHSVAESEESVLATVSGAADLVQKQDADFYLFQEVDLDSTRSYHVNQYEILDVFLSSFYSVFAVNYDSAFLFYPITEPHGKSLAGIATYSDFPIESAVRRKLPVAESFSKFLDLDRCYSVSRIPVENGKYLCMYNVHLSAYGNDASIRAGQLELLCSDMRAEYEAGNYVVCGGDFNHDLKSTGKEEKSYESWAHPFPRESLPEGFSLVLDAFTEEEKEEMHNSSRNADMAYVEGETFTITLDGFIVSENVEVVAYENIDTGYTYADHDPVRMTFTLSE